MQTLEPFELDVTAVHERNVALGARDQIVHQVRHEDLAAERMAGDARRVVHRRPEEVFLVRPSERKPQTSLKSCSFVEPRMAQLQGDVPSALLRLAVDTYMQAREKLVA